MHEYSLVRSLLVQVREAASAERAAVVEEVVVSIGPLAGVEPLLFARAFELLTSETGDRAMRLVIETTPLHLMCQACQYEFDTEDVVFACPACESLRTRVVAGDAVILKRLVLGDGPVEETIA